MISMEMEYLARRVLANLRVFLAPEASKVKLTKCHRSRREGNLEKLELIPVCLKDVRSGDLAEVSVPANLSPP